MELVHGMLVDFEYEGKEYKEVKVWEDIEGFFVRLWAYSKSKNYYFFRNCIQLENLRRSKKFWPVEGDILVSPEGDERKVLGIIGNVFHLSYSDNFSLHGGGCTIEELIKYKYKIKGLDTEEKTVLTMDEIAEKFGVPVDQLKIEKGRK